MGAIFGPHDSEAVIQLTFNNRDVFFHGLRISDHSTTNPSIHQNCCTCEGCVHRSLPTLASEETASEADSEIVGVGAKFASPEDEELWVDFHGAADDLQCGTKESLFFMEAGEQYCAPSLLSDYDLGFTVSSTAHVSGDILLSSRWLTPTPDSCRALPASWAANSDTTGSAVNTNETKSIQSRGSDALLERRTPANNECHDRVNHTLETSRSRPIFVNPETPQQTDDTLDLVSASIIHSTPLKQPPFRPERSSWLSHKQTSGSMESPGPVCTDQCSARVPAGADLSTVPVAIYSQAQQPSLPKQPTEQLILQQFKTRFLTATYNTAEGDLKSHDRCQ